MFVTFEGIDGSGKSTAMANVATMLGARAAVTAEETDEFGAAIRGSIAHRADPLVTTYLFMADRYRHQADLKRLLLDGKVVLCDRYMHSTLAYQGVTLDGRMDDHREWLRGLHANMIQPDRILWFDVPADVAVARAQDRGETAPYEKVDFLTKVAAEYGRLADAEPHRIIRIDATMSPEAVADAAMAAVTAILPA